VTAKAHRLTAVIAVAIVAALSLNGTVSLNGTLNAAFSPTAVLTPTAALAATGRASLTDIENDVMCVACHESLAVAQSPEAYSERQYIRGLISQGLTKKQIENQLVAEYGPAVLGKPPADGFNLVVYVVPPLLVAVGIALLVFTIPRWRRRAKQAASSAPASAPPLDPGEAQRLDEDMARQL
jgi:cytochrome c-type biogenesis protein CcmH